MNDELQPLHDELQDRIEIAKEAIYEAVRAKDFGRAESVSEAVGELETSLAKLVQVRKDVKRAMATFDQLTRCSGNRATQTRLLIKVDWRAAQIDRQTIIIDPPTGAEAMARFVEVMVEVHGVAILADLQRVGAGGSGLVSKTPETDFINPGSGEVYGHRAIGNTGWFVKTHCSTKTKIDQIHQMKAVLGMPRHSIEVEAIER
jgi:hypothetical protein